MIDRETFDRQISQTLSRLNDPPYLRTHPLTGLLVGPSEAGQRDPLQRALRDAIDAMRPPAATPAGTPAWRRYRHLVLRYVDGLSFEATARELLISERQARRDHAEALSLLSSLLWDRSRKLADGAASSDRPNWRARRREAEPTPAIPRPQPPAASGEAGAEVGVGAGIEPGIEAELRRVGASATDEPTELAPVFDGVVATLARLAEARRVAIAVTRPADLAPVAISAVALRQILLNVLSHAINLLPNSDIKVEIVERTGCLEVAVAVQPKAEPIDAAGMARTDRAATLLDVAQRLSEMHGGILEVRPAPAGGFASRLVLPTARTITVLVVDDNPDITRLFRRYLRRGRYRLIQATNGERAIRLADEMRPDIIILDVLLPSRDGWEVLQQIRARESTHVTPVIICSVMPEQDLARSLGATDFLAKPVSERDLVEMLERHRPA